MNENTPDTEEVIITTIQNASNQERLAMGLPLWEKGVPQRKNTARLSSCISPT